MEALFSLSALAIYVFQFPTLKESKLFLSTLIYLSLAEIFLGCTCGSYSYHEIQPHTHQNKRENSCHFPSYAFIIQHDILECLESHLTYDVELLTKTTSMFKLSSMEFSTPSDPYYSSLRRMYILAKSNIGRRG
jgi:hypothetical protein